jgi:hypothetical protein
VSILRSRPRRWGSWSAVILSGEDPVTELDISLFRSRGSFELEGERYFIDPEGFWGLRSVLRKGDTPLARSEKPSFLRRRFRITSAGHRLDLESRSWRGRHYALVLGSRDVGSISLSGFLGTKLELEFPDDVPLFLQVYLAYLVLCQAKMEAAASSGG